MSVVLCWPLAIPAINFSTQVNSKWALGDVAGAESASRKAKTFALWGTIIGVAGALIYFIGIMALAAARTSTG